MLSCPSSCESAPCCEHLEDYWIHELYIYGMDKGRWRSFVRESECQPVKKCHNMACNWKEDKAFPYNLQATSDYSSQFGDITCHTLNTFGENCGKGNGMNTPENFRVIYMMKYQYRFSAKLYQHEMHEHFRNNKKFKETFSPKLHSISPQMLISFCIQSSNTLLISLLFYLINILML